MVPHTICFSDRSGQEGMFYSSGMLTVCCQPLQMDGNVFRIHTTWWPWEHNCAQHAQIVICLWNDGHKGQAVRSHMTLPNMLVNSQEHVDTEACCTTSLPPPLRRPWTSHPKYTFLSRRQFLTRINPEYRLLNKRKQIKLHIFGQGHLWEPHRPENMWKSALSIPPF